MSKTKIEWVSQFDENGNIISQGYTFNPWWGCTKVSTGCENCYAEAFAKRLGFNVWGNNPRKFFTVGAWKKPLQWNAKARKNGQRARVFCGSMCDVFEDNDALGIPREDLWELIRNTSQLDWLLLTKRPENMIDMLPHEWVDDFAKGHYYKGMPDNVWLGVTAENQEMADKRIPELLKIPAKIRFLSCEPLLEKINLVGPALREYKPKIGGDWRRNEGKLIENGISWVIVGGESGPNKRPINLNWARSIRDQCQEATIPFFMKQVDKKRSIPEDLLIREFPNV